MKVYDNPSANRPPHVVALYGPPKGGKSRLACSLDWGAEWGEKAVLAAWDPGSAALSSIPLHHRERLIVAAPSTQVNPITKKEVYDPLTEAVQMATYPWKEKYPEVGTLIWDTMTETSRQLLHAYADTGAFSEKHLTFGKPGDASYHAAPMEGDYGAAQRSTMFILQALLKQPINVIVLFHDSIVTPDPKKGDTFLTYGGPAIAGKAGTQGVAGLFDNLFRAEAESKLEGGKLVVHYNVYTAPKGGWLAGFRNPLTTENPLAKVKLESDPSSFWKRFAELQRGANAKA